MHMVDSRHSCAIFVCVVLLSVTGGALCDEGAFGKAWRELFAQSDPSRAEKQIRAVLAACDGNIAALRRAIASDTAYKAYKPGWHKFGGKLTDGKTPYDLDFFVRVPKGYTPNRPWPLLLAAHGQHSDGKTIGRLMALLLGRDRERYVIVAPTMPGPKHYNARLYQEQAYLVPMLWTRTHLNIDDDRMYISGYSQGGHVSWHMAVMYPRLFAAAVPMAGVPWFQGQQATYDMYLMNLSNMPVWALWGEKDTAKSPYLGIADMCRIADMRLLLLKNTTFKGTELPGKGHGGCTPDPNDFAAYLAARKRATRPEEFRRRFHLGHHARGYFLRATKLAWKPIDFAKGVKVKFAGTVKPTREQMRAAIHRQVKKQIFEIKAQLDRPANTLTIRARGVLAVKLFVTDGLFDVRKPATIRYWGKKWSGRVRPSAECILRHYAASRDQTALVLNEMQFSIKGKRTVLYKSGG